MEDDRNLYGRAVGLNERGKHVTFKSAVDAALDDLLTQHNDFFDTIVDKWKALFPNLPACPGRYEDGIIFIYVRSAALSFAVHPKLPFIRSKLAQLPGAPKHIELRVEARARW